MGRKLGGIDFRSFSRRSPVLHVSCFVVVLESVTATTVDFCPNLTQLGNHQKYKTVTITSWGLVVVLGGFGGVVVVGGLLARLLLLLKQKL